MLLFVLICSVDCHIYDVFFFMESENLFLKKCISTEFIVHGKCKYDFYINFVNNTDSAVSLDDVQQCESCQFRIRNKNIHLTSWTEIIVFYSCWSLALRQLQLDGFV